MAAGHGVLTFPVLRAGTCPQVRTIPNGRNRRYPAVARRSGEGLFTTRFRGSLP